jgi:hypothetical protein
MCPMAPGSAFLRGELRCCHVSHGPVRLWTIGIKKGSRPRHVARLTCFQGTLVAPVDVQVATVHLYSATSAQLPLLDIATEVILSDRMAPRYELYSLQQSDKIGQLHVVDALQDIICYS